MKVRFFRAYGAPLGITVAEAAAPGGGLRAGGGVHRDHHIGLLPQPRDGRHARARNNVDLHALVYARRERFGNVREDLVMEIIALRDQLGALNGVEQLVFQLVVVFGGYEIPYAAPVA